MKSKSKLHPALFLGAMLVSTFLVGCATSAPKVISNPDKAVNYANYKSYMMLKPSGFAPARDAAITPSLIRELREAATAAFAAKGLSKSDAPSSDAFVLIHGGVYDKVEIKELGYSYGRFGRGPVGGQAIDTTKEGSLFVDVFDGKTRELVWRGSAVAEVSEMPDMPTLKATLDSIIARYPN